HVPAPDGDLSNCSATVPVLLLAAVQERVAELCVWESSVSVPAVNPPPPPTSSGVPAEANEAGSFVWLYSVAIHSGDRRPACSDTAPIVPANRVAADVPPGRFPMTMSAVEALSVSPDTVPAATALR